MKRKEVIKKIKLFETMIITPSVDLLGAKLITSDRIRYGQKEFLVEFEDGSCDWLTLDDKHKLVYDYYQSPRDLSVTTLSSDKEYAEWLANDYRKV